MRALIWTDKNGNKVRVNHRRFSCYNDYSIEYRSVTEQEIEELWIPTTVEIQIPLGVLMNSEEIQKKIQFIDIVYNWLERRTVDWYLHIGNIDVNDVIWYISLDEYVRMKNAWVIFPPEIIAIFENWENEQPENPSENPIDTVSENENLESGEPWVENTQVEE